MNNIFQEFEQILKLYIKDDFIKELPRKWNESHRFYHNENHLIEIINNIEKNPDFKYLNVYEKHALLLAAFFHDVIYDPKRNDNEDKSIEFFKASFKNDDPKMINTVCYLIETTKYRKKPLEKLANIFWKADNQKFMKGYDELIKNEQLIRKEYNHLSPKEYKEKRIKFLESCKGLFNYNVDKDLDKLIKYINEKYK